MPEGRIQLANSNLAVRVFAAQRPCCTGSTKRRDGRAGLPRRTDATCQADFLFTQGRIVGIVGLSSLRYPAAVGRHDFAGNPGLRALWISSLVGEAKMHEEGTHLDEVGQLATLRGLDLSLNCGGAVQGMYAPFLFRHSS